MKNLKKLLDNNCNVVIKDKDDDGYYSLFVPLKSEDGYYRNSYWKTTIEEAKKSSISCDGYDEDDIERISKRDNWQIVEVYRTTTQPLAVGTPVKILDSIKDTYDWDDIKEYFPEMKGIIKYIYNDVTGLRCGVKGINDTRLIGAEYIILDIEEENTMPVMDEMKKLFDNFCTDADKLIK